MSLSLAVLVSGGGSNLQAIIDAIEDGRLDASIKLVLSNKADAYGLTRAANHGLPTAVLQHGDYDSREAFDAAMISTIRDHGADVIILAGFMRILTPGFIREFAPNILNTHPALLPSFAGAHGARDAVDYGVRISGCTIHFVNEIMDNGPVIIQAAVPALPGEDPGDLAKRILRYEHRIFPQAIQWLAEGRLSIDGRHVHVQDAEAIPATSTPGALVCPALDEGF